MLGSSPAALTKGRVAMTKFILVCVLCSGCAVETTAPDGGYVEPSSADEPSFVGGGGENDYMPNCVPDMAYTIGGELVIVPGYCHPGDKDLSPVDPDPFLGNSLKDPLTDPTDVLGSMK